MPKSIFALLICVCSFTFSLAQEKISQHYSEGLAVVKKKTPEGVRFGFADEKGKLVLDYRYDTVYKPFRQGLATVGLYGKAGLINKKGKAVIPIQYKEIGEVTRNIVPVKNEQGLWGFLKKDGKKITDCVYNNYRYSHKGRIIVQYRGKWGIIEGDGRIAVPFSYNYIQYLDGKNFRVHKINTWQIKDQKNKVVASFEFDSLKPASENTFIYSLIGSYGLVAMDGTVLTDPVYEEIGTFKNNVAPALKGKWGAVDLKGKEILSFTFDKVVVEAGFIIAGKKIRNGYRYQLYNYDGVLVGKDDFDETGHASENFCAVRKKTLWGFADKSGALVVPCKYREVSMVSDDLFEVTTLSNQKMVLGRKGETVVEAENYAFYKNGIYRIDKGQKTSWVVPKHRYDSFEQVRNDLWIVSKSGKYGIINTAGKEVIPVKYDAMLPPSPDGYIPVSLGRKWGILNMNNHFTVPLTYKYERIYPYRDGLFRVLVNKKFGFIDGEGNMWISPQYAQARDCSEGMVPVVIRDKWGFLDHKEVLKAQPYYESVSDFKNGSAIVKEGNTWNLIDKNGRQLHTVPFDKIVRTKYDRYLLYKDNKLGLADKNGREALAPKYDAIEELGDNKIKVKKDGLWGILDYNENIVIPVENDVVFYDSITGNFFTGKKGRLEVMQVK
jgi:hypothetical protein